VLREHLATFLSRASEHDGPGLPRFVTRELERTLTCGVLAYGFARRDVADRPRRRGRRRVARGTSIHETPAAHRGGVESSGIDVAMPRTGAGDEIDQLALTLDRTFSRMRESYARQARFSADAAHELRTPLSVVLTQGEVALRRERTPDEYRETIREAVDAVRRMQQTPEALLLLARGDAGDLGVRGGRADLAAITRESVSPSAAAAAAKSISVRVE